MRITDIARSFPLAVCVTAAPAQELKFSFDLGQRDGLGAADRLQVLGLGNSQLAIETDDDGDDVARQASRAAAILWR